MMCYVHIYVSLLWFFFYDILVYSPTISGHARRLSNVLMVFVAYLKKCEFAASQVEYLGHLVSS